MERKNTFPSPLDNIISITPGSPYLSLPFFTL